MGSFISASRITLWRVTMGKMLRKSPEISTTKLSHDSASSGELIDKLTINWQEKIFSRKELDSLQTSTNCATPLQMEYHNMLQSNPDLHFGRSQSVFTYVDKDCYDRGLSDTDSMTSAESETESYLTSRVHSLQLHRKRLARIPVNEFPTAENIITASPDPAKRVPQRVVQKLYIMAQLSDEEKLLAAISIDQDGVIHITPDFNSTHNPYLIKASENARDLYEYTIEHASEKATHEQQAKEEEIFKQLYGKHRAYQDAKIGRFFNMVCVKWGHQSQIDILFSQPNENELRCYIVGDIGE